MVDLCKYKNALGIPGQGVHSFRFFNIAIADVVMTIIAAFIIALLTKQKFYITLILLFLLGIFLHRIFCVRTTLDKLLFPNEK
jgi:fatty acid desaturase